MNVSIAAVNQEIKNISTKKIKTTRIAILILNRFEIYIEIQSAHN